jgi:hypothetical protein
MIPLFHKPIQGIKRFKILVRSLKLAFRYHKVSVSCLNVCDFTVTDAYNVPTDAYNASTDTNNASTDADFTGADSVLDIFNSAFVISK